MFDEADFAKRNPLDGAKELIVALRNPLPDDFKWDFRYAIGCGCKIAAMHGIMKIDFDGTGVELPDALRQIGLQVSDITENPFFCNLDQKPVALYGCFPSEVLPQMVADKLELLVQRAEAT
jgi:hypothetical protein